MLLSIRLRSKDGKERVGVLVAHKTFKKAVTGVLVVLFGFRKRFSKLSNCERLAIRSVECLRDRLASPEKVGDSECPRKRDLGVRVGNLGVLLFGQGHESIARAFLDFRLAAHHGEAVEEFRDLTVSTRSRGRAIFTFVALPILSLAVLSAEKVGTGLAAATAQQFRTQFLLRLSANPAATHRTNRKSNRSWRGEVRREGLVISRFPTFLLSPSSCCSERSQIINREEIRVLSLLLR